ncbi:MAG: hypothetical protein R2761_30865 [Acidimicrobiales bacterium]
MVSLSEVRGAADDPLFARLRDLSEPGGSADDGDGDGAQPLLDQLGAALPGPNPVVRGLVAVLAVAQLAVVLPWLVDADPFGLLGSSTSSHLTRDGALGLAVAVAGLMAAWRPRWAVPCFLLASAALVAQALSGLFDPASAGAGGTELVHVPSVILTCLVGLSGIRLTPLGPGPRRRS